MAKFYCKFPVFVLLVFSVFGSSFAENVTTTLIGNVLQQSKEDNVIVSPFLLFDGLMQLYLGSEGKASEEIAKFLQLTGLRKSEAVKRYKEWHTLNSKPNSVTLDIASRIYAARDINILTTFKKTTADIFNSEIEAVDFANASETVSIVNKWIAERTNNKITELIETTDPLTKILLLSAIYFKGTWQTKFEKLNTKKKVFFTPRGDGKMRKSKVYTMTQVNNYKYKFVKKLEAHALELPYATSNVSMLILLPNSVNGIGKIEQNLYNLDFEEIIPRNFRTMELALPKFKFDYKQKFNDIVKGLGIREIFENGNFTFMSDQPNLYVSEILQKSVIEVDENGTTAAAVQVFNVNHKSAVSRFEVNRPFVFLIKDNDNVYFAGRMSSFS
ncbi:serpin B11-like [Drosophila novamexicana]|uniref:serpin B11-like n=1 Tax=Drosophila novamexicana TaxID=47314 RepID=UPI0011E5B0A9|nr:serpin B11-like [Drosophila novamexicana]